MISGGNMVQLGNPGPGNFVWWEEPDGKIPKGLTSIEVESGAYRYLSATGNNIDFAGQTIFKFPDPAGTKAVIIKRKRIESLNKYETPMRSLPDSYDIYLGKAQNQFSYYCQTHDDTQCIKNKLYDPSLLKSFYCQTHSDIRCESNPMFEPSSSPAQTTPAPEAAPAAVPASPPTSTITPQKQRMLDFQANPDIIKFLGTLPDTTLNAFSRVFQGWDIYEDNAATAEPGDYAGVGLMLAGLALGASAGIAGVLAKLGITGAIIAPTASTVTSDTMWYTAGGEALGSSVAAKAAGWSLANVPQWLMKIAGAYMGIHGFGTFMQFIGEETIQTAGIGIWPLISNKQWASASEAVDILEKHLDKYESTLSLTAAISPLSYPFFKQYYEAGRDQIASYRKTLEPYLQEIAPKPAIPEKITGKVVGITDGDTIIITEGLATNHTVRLVGIDAQESKTKEGKAATLYLTNLIHGKTIDVLVDPSIQYDDYGRVLGTVMLGSKNINLEMLKAGHAQPYLFEPNKYVDPEAYKSAYTPIGKLKLTSSPSNSRIWIDGIMKNNLTPETYELLPQKYQIKITRSKYDDYAAEVEVKPGETTEYHADLSKAGQTLIPTAATPGELITPTEELGTLVLSSSPSNSRIWINGENMHNLTPETYTLPPGTYEVKLTRSNYDDAVKTYTLVASETVYDHINLFKAGQTPTEELPEAKARRLFIQLMDQLGLTSEDVVKLLEA